jgi:preprotein translocase subunit SecA
MSRDELQENLVKMADDSYTQREKLFGEENMRELEKVVMLRVVDNHWMEHLDRMDMLREGINLRAYGQVNPLVQYKIEALDMFEEMEGSIQDDIAKYMYRVSIVTPQEQEAQKQHLLEEQQRQLQDHLANAQASHGDEVEAAEAKGHKQPVRAEKKPGRNDPCPCGSGKKYKNCCGRNE